MALHFRLGDYHAHQRIYIILRKDYYVAALSALVAATHRDDWTVMCFEAGGSEADRKEVGALVGHMRVVFPHIQFTSPPDGLNDVSHSLSCRSVCTKSSPTAPSVGGRPS